MKGRANYLCLHKLDQLARRRRPGGPRRVPADHPRVVDAHRDRRSRGAAGSAGGSRVLERGLGDRRHLPRHRVPALRRLLRHPDAPARRRVRRRHRQPSPAVRRRGGPAERVRRGDPRVHAARSSTKRTSSRTSRRSISASTSAPTASRSWRATSSGWSPPAASRIARRQDEIAKAVERLRDHAQAFFTELAFAHRGHGRAQERRARARDAPSRSARPTTPPST